MQNWIKWSFAVDLADFWRGGNISKRVMCKSRKYEDVNLDLLPITDQKNIVGLVLVLDRVTTSRWLVI